MECNKEEAFRAKALAEKKLQSKDFQGAHKFALKAQRLYSDLQNISQMLMVCEVHCSAEKRLSDAEMDWYGILQLQQTADDTAIKKQYKKFALKLHPDKNKFPGAEAAFKLIGEAQMVLLDREKRRIHDMKRSVTVRTAGTRGTSHSRASVPHHTQPKANGNPGSGVEVNFGAKYATFSNQYTYAPPPPYGFPNFPSTFWTICPSCLLRHQYHGEFMNKLLICQNCRKTYIALDASFPGPASKENFPGPTPTANVCGGAPTVNVKKPRFPEQESSPNHGHSKEELKPEGSSTAEIKRPQVPQNSVFQSAPATACKVQSRKRERGPDEESSESIDSESSSESEEVEEIMAESDFFQGKRSSTDPVRRSVRQRQKVSYKDSFSDDDDDEEDGGESLSGTKGNGQVTEEKESQVQKEAPRPTGPDGDNQKDHMQKKSDGPEEGSPSYDNSDIGMETEEVSDRFEYSDSEFYEFYKDRLEECFSVGETWAVYDSPKAMPRFYAQIKKVLSPSSKLKVCWLEPSPTTKNEIEWVESDLPVSCGKFVLGEDMDIEDQSSFSHRMNYEKGTGKTCMIYPAVGETWAIFKNWSIKWHIDPSNHENCEYEFVEILSDYDKDGGVRVALLGKVKDFVSLFVQTSREGSSYFQIGPKELYRFSHRVPSFRLTGKEREGVPEGCLELDPASLPLNIEEIEFSSYANVGKQKVATFSEHVYPPVFPNGKETSVSKPVHPPSFPHAEPFDVPDTEFHNFDDGKSPEKFQAGQIWALYSDEDCLPKYYCQIFRAETTIHFELHVRWHDFYMLPNDVTGWENKDMPICCGRFKLRKGRPAIYTDVCSFSHCMKAVPLESGFCEIYPEKGDVWALYRHWNPAMRVSDLENCEYDLVEVINKNESVVKVSVLEQDKELKSVFKPQLRGGSKVSQEIPLTEILRFSHQVPAFQLAEEMNGSLRGCWELDTAALPIRFFRSK